MSKKASRFIIIAICFVIAIAVTIGGFFYINSHRPMPIFTPNTDTAEVDTNPPYNFDYSWTEHPYIAHALGGIMGDVYTNSYEAFLLNYQLGQRVFEIDFLMTDDGETVALHDPIQWNDSIRQNTNMAFTSNNFLSSLFNGKYHTIDYHAVIDLMLEYPDIYLVTDSKYIDKAHITAEFNQIISYAKTKDAAVLDHFIIQIYHPEMLDWMMDLYPWKSVIYTLYQDPNWTPANVVQFARASGIQVIAIAETVLSLQPETAKLWNEAGLTIASFTINDLTSAHKLWDNYGVKIIYTDFLLPYTKP